MLELQHVTKTFGRNATATMAVTDVSMRMSTGVVGLIGHNGAGKTTLMNMIATLTRPTHGHILFDGVDIAKSPDAIRRRLGFLPQDFGVYANLTAQEFLEYFAALKGVRDPARIHHLLELVNLHDHARREAAGFSGGMRRRLGIAQALLNDPDILIVDEPTAGLDPEERLRFRHLLAEIGFAKLVIVSTHIVSDIENMAGSLAIMRKGRLVAFETPERILDAARGSVWSATVDSGQYEKLSGNVRVLHAQRQAHGIQVRVAHPSRPFDHAEPAEPSLEEALMAHQHAAFGLRPEAA